MRSLSCWCLTLLAFIAIAWPVTARAQYIETYLPTTIPGFDQDQGVAVLTRARPLYDALGVRVGDFTFSPALDESFGYNSNLEGTEHALGSAFIETAPSVDIASDWARDRIGLHASLDNTVDLEAPAQSHTDGTIGLGGSTTIGQGQASLGYTHLSEHENGTDIGSIASQKPIGYDVDDVRGAWDLPLGPLVLTPNFDVDDYRFGNGEIAGQSRSQSFRNRVVARGGVTAHDDTGATELLLVLQGLDSHYTEGQTGQPSQDSKSILALGGFDTANPEAVWRLRVLAGVEYRSFTAPDYAARTEPVVEGSVIWAPSRLVTVTGTLSRTVEDPQSEGTAGYVYDVARLVADYELRRNILLQGRLGFQDAEFLQGGGNQTIVSAGAGATWMVARGVRVSLAYDFSDQRSPLNEPGILTTDAGPVLLTGGNYTQHLVLLRLHLAL